MSVITVVTKIADHRERSERPEITGHFVDVVGPISSREVKANNLIDGMLDAQDDLGQVRWVDLSQTIAKGLATDQQHGGEHRVIVVDEDNADGGDIISAMLWVQRQPG